MEITGGTVTGGKALHATNGKGGNIYVGAASVQISGGTLTMGQAAVSGGNLCIAHEQVNEQAYTIDGCQIVHGQAAAGGNICTVNSSLKIGRNAVITEGVSSWPKGSSFAGGGGNIFCQGGQMLIYGQISDGTANLTGGNMELRGTVVQLLDGGKVSDGRADYDGGNVYLNQNASFVISNSTVSGGAAGRSGDNILAEGWAVLEGNAQAWDNGGILLGSAAHLRVYKDFSGEVAVDGLDLPVQPYGEVLDPEHFECTGNYSGKIWLPQFTDKPCLFGDGNKLFVGAVYTVKNGGKTWFADNASAVTGYGEADYLVPVGDVTLTGGTYTVDLAGQDLKITGEGRLYCFDSSNDSYKSCGSAVISGPVLKNELAHTVQGKHYIRIRTDGVYSFHRLNLRISDVSLRMNNVGIYYSALWECDDAAASVIQGFGIGVSLADMPTETLRYDEDTKHTYHSRSEFVSGIKTQGVLIQNVFRPYDPEDPDRSAKNSLYGRLPIYAKAYVVLDNGVDRIQTLVSNDNVALSMHDVLSSIDEDMTFYYSAAQRLCDFRDYWHRNGLNDGNWDFTFSVPVQIVQLQQLYSGTNGVTGQLVSDAGQSPSLEAWKEQLTAAGMNFVSVPGQGRNPVSENWDSNAFIAGLEATLTVDGTKVDCNFLFADETQLCNVLSYGDVFTYDASAKTFTVKDVDAATFVALVEQVRANDGLVLLSDPKQTGMADSQDALDYWYTDGVAMDVFHTADSQQNYKLWTDLLAEGKRVWAAASNAAQPVGQGNVIALQAAKNSAQAYMQKLASGNYSCGPVAILMAVGDAPMGSSIDFTGKELAFCVDEAVTGVLEDGHTYRLDLISSKGVLQSWAYNGRTMFKVVEADVNQAFYRMELVDETTGQILSLSNPIWNESYGLRLGFARQDITPDYTVQIVGGKARVSKGVVEGDGIFLTCVAMQEGDQTYLLFTADLISADSSRYVANLKRAVSNATGIPVANIVFSTTHTHSSVGVGVDSWTAEAGGTENLNRFRQDLYAAAETVAAAAIDDLAVVDAAYAGSVTGKTDVAFVRHYEKRDGTVDYSNEGGYETAENILQVYTKGCQYKAHATEADNEIQLVKFERAGAENVILMSVPAHATLNENSEKLSADFPHYARTYIEKQTGSKVACFIGAAGDQVPRSKLSNYYLKQTMNVSNNTDAKVYGEKLGSYAVEALDRGLPQLRSTAIKASYIVYEGTLGTDHFDQYETAKELAQRVAAGEENIDATCRSNGFAGSSDVSGTVKRYEYYLKNGTDLSMGLRIMAVGELGFVFAPYEMSGANGRQLKDAAPYATTFIASCTDDNVSYVASQDAFDHESYEAQCCWFEAGTGELLARYIAEALEQQKFNIR